jgi:excisionase family DNA binding protein
VRTLTVKEAAQALGVSVRTVQHRLNTGELKGKRTPNQYGVSEWRVWPNKEIMERLSPGKSFEELDFSAPQEEFQGGDSSAVVDAEAVEGDRDDLDEPSLRTIVRELTLQFSEQLSREKTIVAQLQRDLEDKDRQLKLLPDFQKQAEDQRKEAELKELESIALRKQVEALKNEEEASQAEIARLAKLEAEVMPSLAAQKEAQEAEVAKLQSDLEIARNEKQMREEQAKTLEAENERLKQKAEEATLSAAKLEQLEKEIQQLKQPKPSFWKKLFMPGGAQES